MPIQGLSLYLMLVPAHKPNLNESRVMSKYQVSALDKLSRLIGRGIKGLHKIHDCENSNTTRLIFMDEK